MFWRKKADGFDWHQYVRTTIKLRRDQRRAKLEDIGRAAAHQARAAGDAAVLGAAQVASSGWRATAAAWHATIAQPAVALPIFLIGSMALLSGIYRWLMIAPDRDALLPLALGAVMLTLLAPLLLVHWGFGIPGIPRTAISKLPTGAAPAIAVGACVLALGWFAWGHVIPGAPGGSGPTTSIDNRAGLARVLEGRPTVLSGEMINLQGKLLHLSGIEAPDRQQTCTRGGSEPWRCGEAALAALERLAKSRTFRCVAQGGPDAGGRIEAICTVDGRDVAAELVRDGHVFSAATYFGGYAALESEARRSRTGVWSGDADRPAAFRAKRWEAAKASAPGGCPIKGHLSGNRKIYIMPWAADYDRTTIRPARGDKWFCSEDEATAAGFKTPRAGTRVATR